MRGPDLSLLHPIVPPPSRGPPPYKLKGELAHTKGLWMFRKLQGGRSGTAIFRAMSRWTFPQPAPDDCRSRVGAIQLQGSGRICRAASGQGAPAAADGRAAAGGTPARCLAARASRRAVRDSAAARIRRRREVPGHERQMGRPADGQPGRASQASEWRVALRPARLWYRRGSRRQQRRGRCQAWPAASARRAERAQRRAQATLSSSGIAAGIRGSYRRTRALSNRG
jgi:hypothetical protein